MLETNIIIVFKTLASAYLLINILCLIELIKRRKFYSKKEFMSNVVWFGVFGTLLLLLVGWANWFKECDEGMSESDYEEYEKQLLYEFKREGFGQ